MYALKFFSITNIALLETVLVIYFLSQWFQFLHSFPMMMFDYAFNKSITSAGVSSIRKWVTVYSDVRKWKTNI